MPVEGLVILCQEVDEVRKTYGELWIARGEIFKLGPPLLALHGREERVDDTPCFGYEVVDYSADGGVFQGGFFACYIRHFCGGIDRSMSKVRKKKKTKGDLDS
jgi:hypothetical protein